jgi:hypothetical protein
VTPDLDRERLEGLLTALTERLAGDWLLVGGALAALWLRMPGRTTEDVDLVGLTGTPEERLALMRFAEEAGLPIETLNSAADFFVRRVPGWQQEIELLRAGSKARIYRPSPTLFLLLKIGRLSEQDLGDCLAMVEKTRSEALALDVERVLAALESLPPSPLDPGLETRRSLLRQTLVGTP